MIIHNGGPLLDHKQIVMFPFDDHSVPHQHGLRLHLVGYQHGCGGTRIVLSPGPEGAPDSRLVVFYGTVRRVGDELWMWYLGQGEEADWHERICLAKSRDGKHWERPQLGLVQYKGSRDNNLVDLEGGREHIASLVVFFEPEDPDPQRRFKLIYQTRNTGVSHVNLALSPDGLRWTKKPIYPAHLAFEMSGGTKVGRCYYVCGHGGGHFGEVRMLQTYISYDFEHWTEASCLGLRRGNIPPRPVAEGPHGGEQIHLGASLWNRGNIILGFYGQWHGHPSQDRRRLTMDLGLAVSNDALHYREPIPDFRLVAVAEDGWDWPPTPITLPTPGLVQGQGFENIHDETLFWYAPWPEHASNGIRLATWPRDRLGYFESYLARKVRSLQDSHFISAPLDLRGKRGQISLNVAYLSEYGRVTVEILDEEFRCLQGFSREECMPPEASGICQPVRWRAHEAIEGVTCSVRVRVNWGGVRPEDTRVYAVYVDE